MEDETYKGLEEFSSNKELALVQVFEDYPDCLLKIFTFCCVIFMLIGILGNMLTIAALSSYQRVRNATGMFIINLAVSDLLYAIIVLPIAILSFINKSWVAGVAMCRWFPILNYGLNAASVFSIVAIAINRYVLVAHPFLYPQFYQKRNLILMIVSIWLGAFGMLLPTALEWWGRFSLDPNVGFCTIIPDNNGNSPKKSILIMEFAFPTFFIVVCYSRIIYIVRISTRRSSSKDTSDTSKSDTTNQEESSKNENSSQAVAETIMTQVKKSFNETVRKSQKQIGLQNVPTKRDKRLQSVIAAVFVSYFSCHLPIMLAKCLNDECKKPCGNTIGYLFLFACGSINPLIYVVMSKEYRKAYRCLIKKLKKSFCDIKYC